jgi:hypothetical protein
MPRRDVDRSAAAEHLIARPDRLADAQRGSVPAVRGAYLMSAHICTPDGNGFLLERRGCGRTGHAGLGQYFISRQLVTRHRSVPRELNPLPRRQLPGIALPRASPQESRKATGEMSVFPLATVDARR